MDATFERFIRERQYITNVSPRTVELYRRCLVWLPSPNPQQPELKELVIKLRERGLTPAGANIVIRTCNAFLHWASGSERGCGSGCVHPRIPRVMENRDVMPTFTEQQIQKLVKWRPQAKDFFGRRLHLLILTLFDTGARIGELLKLKTSDVDLDNLILKLDGKGRRQRLVPFSLELRRPLFKFIADFKLGEHSPLFTTRDGAELQHRNVYRAIVDRCRALGFEPPKRVIHAFRHSFAVGYVRRGGSPFHLQRMLGHSTLEMSKRYCSLTIDDLKASHERLSPLRPL
jgi:integrase/recombinase XerD